MKHTLQQKNGGGFIYTRKTQKNIHCPLEYGLSIFGGKWKARILCVLSSKPSMRYSEIMHQMGNITDAVLSSSLRELVRDGLLNRIQYAEIPPRVEYSLTEHGRSVLPILGSIAQWAGAIVREEIADEGKCSCCSFTEKE